MEYDFPRGAWAVNAGTGLILGQRVQPSAKAFNLAIESGDGCHWPLRAAK